MKKLIATVICILLVVTMVIPAYAISSVKITGFKLDKTSITLDVGASSQLNATFTPKNTTQTMLTYASNNAKVATVTDDGAIKAVGAGKATITVTSVSNAALKATVAVTVKAKAVTTLSVMLFDRGNVGGTPPDNNFYSKWVQDQFHKANPDINLKFVTAPRWTSDDKLNIWMASNQTPDVAFTYTVDLVYNYYKQGGLTQLDTAFNAYGQNLSKFMGPALVKQGRWYGQLWNIPAKRIINAQQTTWIRTDWLKAVGLSTPTTRDEWYNAMKTFKEKNPAHVGKVVPFGLTNDVQWTAKTLLESFCTAKDDQSRYLASGIMKLTAPGYKEGVRFLNKMYNEGLVSKEFALDTEGKILEADMANNQVGSEIQGYDVPLRSAGTGYIPTLRAKYPGFDLQPIDCFPDKDGATTKILYDQAGLRIFVPKTSEKKVNEAIRYLNWMADKDVIFFLQYGEEGVGYTMKNGLPVYQPVKTGEKQFNSANNIDYTLIINGIDTGDMAKNIKINSLAYGDVQDLFIKSYTMAITNGYVEPTVSIPSDMQGKYATTLTDKSKEVFAKTIACKSSEFDATWSKMITEFMKVGGNQVLTERRKLWVTDHAK